jgi:hypothetical protein
MFLDFRHGLLGLVSATEGVHTQVIQEIFGSLECLGIGYWANQHPPLLVAGTGRYESVQAVGAQTFGPDRRESFFYGAYLQVNLAGNCVRN